jgi:hypothetical protein
MMSTVRNHQKDVCQEAAQPKVEDALLCRASSINRCIAATVLSHDVLFSTERIFSPRRARSSCDDASARSHASANASGVSPR